MSRCLYISYDGLTEPIGRSQIMPYITGLSEKGVDFTVLTFDKTAYRAKREEVSDIYGALNRKGIKWVSLVYHKNPPVLSTLFDVVLGIGAAAFLIIRHNIKIVHARSYVAALIAISLKKVFAVRIIFDMRGFWADERVEAGLWPEGCLIFRTAKYFEKRFLIAADEIIVLTQTAKEILCKLAFLDNLKVSIIPCSVDVGVFNFNPTARNGFRSGLKLDGRIVFLHAGSLESWYMLRDMAAFVREVKGAGQEVHFIILSHQRKNIYDLIRGAGLDNREVSVLSSSYDEIPKYISAADVGLFFITPTPSKAASIPSKFAEYLSCGLPVVCNRKIGNLDKVITENRVGVLIDEFGRGEYKKKAEELAALLRDTKIRQRCRDTALRFFSMDAAVEKYKRIYNALTEEGGSR